MTDDTVLERLLPLNRESAIRYIIDISNELCSLSDRELEKLNDDDFVGVALMQDEKAAMSERYARASEEFHARLSDFRGANPDLLKRLEILQQVLGTKASLNADILSRMMEKLQQNTHTTLLNVQSMAQNGGASYPSNQSKSSTAADTRRGTL